MYRSRGGPNVLAFSASKCDRRSARRLYAGRSEIAAANAMGIKGIGEIGLLGVAAAIANAVFHATGRRLRSSPITIDQLL